MPYTDARRASTRPNGVIEGRASDHSLEHANDLLDYYPAMATTVRPRILQRLLANAVLYLKVGPNRDSPGNTDFRSRICVVP